MDEYIKREAVLMKLMQDGCSAKNLQSISDIPGADVAPVVHGRWIKDNDSFQISDYCCYFDHTCSECGKIINDRYEFPNYCPNCGAKMDEEETKE